MKKYFYLMVIALCTVMLSTCTEVIVRIEIDVTDISLNKILLALEEGENETLNATVTPDNATDQTVTWTSSDTAIATVDNTGNVIAVKDGAATITAQAGDKTATCAVTVSSIHYALAFEYTNHTGNTDRFYDEVKKINLYVFDENGLVLTTSATGPFEKGFKIPLNLPTGRYTIITWGNMLEGQPFAVTPAFVPGVTTIQEARLVLRQYADNLRLENLFFGEREVDIPLYYSKTDTVSLINNTHNVRVVLHWDHTGAPVDHRQSS